MNTDTLTTVADTLANAMSPVTGTSQESLNVLDLAMKGGWIMIILAILSIIGIYIFFERYSVLRNAAQKNPSLLARLHDNIKDKDRIYSLVTTGGGSMIGHYGEVGSFLPQIPLVEEWCRFHPGRQVKVSTEKGDSLIVSPMEVTSNFFDFFGIGGLVIDLQKKFHTGIVFKVIPFNLEPWKFAV